MLISGEDDEVLVPCCVPSSSVTLGPVPPLITLSITCHYSAGGIAPNSTQVIMYGTNGYMELISWQSLILFRPLHLEEIIHVVDTKVLQDLSG